MFSDDFDTIMFSLDQFVNFIVSLDHFLDISLDLINRCLRWIVCDNISLGIDKELCKVPWNIGDVGILFQELVNIRSSSPIDISLCHHWEVDIIFLLELDDIVSRTRLLPSELVAGESNDLYIIGQFFFHLNQAFVVRVSESSL